MPSEDPRAEPMRTIIAHQTMCLDAAEIMTGWAHPRGLAEHVEDAVGLCIAANMHLQAMFDRVERGSNFAHYEGEWMRLQRDRIDEALRLFDELREQHKNAPIVEPIGA